MLAALALSAASAAAAQQAGDPPDRLVVGRTIRGEVGEADARVHSSTLDAFYVCAPTIGRTYELRVDEAGAYRIDLRSFSFDTYLVLRGADEVVLAEDDDGGVGLHARIVADLEPGATYSVEACAVHGRRGDFELSLAAGRPAPVTRAEKVRLARADLEKRRAAVGAKHPDYAFNLLVLAQLLEAQRDYDEAKALYEQALAIDDEVLGPEHPDTAIAATHLGHHLDFRGEYDAARSLYERALATFEKALGPEHPLTGVARGNLADVPAKR